MSFNLGPKVIIFSMDLHNYGLDVDLLTKVYDEIQAKKKGSFPWSLKGIPEIGFYKDLHDILKHWPKTCSAPIVELYILLSTKIYK